MFTDDIAHRGSQFYNDGLMWLTSPWIVQDGRPKIIDARLMIIFRMG